ncbi:glycoside hydrolase superfamily [Scenedesmus sp. NREL 46B-D3]|nr:glycoside hydrolase superfamily [Scenedesmus sp. NREL 46B-D3]
MLQAQPGGNGLSNGSSSAAPALAGSSTALRPSSSFDIPILQNSLGHEVFVKGVGTHMWQSSGDESSNWTHILKSWGLLNYPRFLMARLFGGLTVLESCPNSWDRYEEDASLSASLGCNGFRLSLEWSRIEPRRGHIDQAAVQRYRDIFGSLLRRGMTPNATLHHFTHPQWFDELGGFTKAENIPLFVKFAVKAVELFGDQCQLWATFNEPTSSSTMGFIFGAYPPGQMLGLQTAGEALLNMLRAHTAAYRAIKALPGGERHKIGLTHMIIPFSHWPDLGPLTAHSRFAARWLTFWWGYDLMHEYLQSGRFAWCVPSLDADGSSCKFVAEDGKPPMDWFGVNFYSRPVLSPFLTPGRKPWQVLSDLGYPIDPEGMHEVLVRCSVYGVPLYVTETGVSINSQRHRQYMIDSYVKEILRAMAEGVDVRGLYYWTLLDNFEW